LAKALESVDASNLAASMHWDVLVVDNNSSDQTRLVVEKFCGWHAGRFRYVFEPHPGKAYAKNTGARNPPPDAQWWDDQAPLGGAECSSM